MHASTKPTNSSLFVFKKRLVSSRLPSRPVRVVNWRKGMKLGLILGGFEGRGEFLGFNGRGVVGNKCGVRGGDWDLEGEILEFMRKSGKPEAFPKRKELVEAGRMDLVMRIEREGGWLSWGWDLEDEVVGCGRDVASDWEAIMAGQSSFQVYDIRSDAAQENGSSVADGNEDFGGQSSWPDSSSNGSLVMNGEEATGVEGILSRLERDRNTAFSVSLKEQKILDHALSDDGGSSQGVKALESISTATAIVHDGSSERAINNHFETRSQASVMSDYRESVSVRPDTWRRWSERRAGISDIKFEAAEISLDRESDTETANISGDSFLATTEGGSLVSDRRDDCSTDRNGPDFIRTRLRNLEIELSNTLQSLRSKSLESKKPKGSEDLLEKMQNLSDAWEFQQTEIMHAKDTLRSLRAKLAILEGKTSLAIVEAQKMAESKQKKIDKARQALQLLRTTCVIWPNAASEVLLTGSFDGWRTKLRMEKSTTGSHSLTLKLYPGVYEIKFIVDGIWRIDPLRPITYNNGFENNFLIVS